MGKGTEKGKGGREGEREWERERKRGPAPGQAAALSKYVQRTGSTTQRERFGAMQVGAG